jgi:hypothetical protein
VKCEFPTSPRTESPIDGAATAKTGGPSSASAEPDKSRLDTADSVAPAEASDAAPAEWRLDGRPVLGHRVVRSAVLASQDLHLVLSAGEAEDRGPVSFEIPESVLRWLLTGEP